MKAKSDIGLIGLAVMGENLVMNMENHGYQVAVYNRTRAKTEHFLATRAKGRNIQGTYSFTELAGSLESPRKVVMLVKAGQPVDDCIEKLLEVLEPGDVIIDSGNSNYLDTMRRAEYVESRGLLFVGNGISGGEEGALHGPSMMPGGSKEAWPLIKDIFQAVSAKVADGSPCCEWVGPGGAGHFVKMVHNGIEYGDMQLICESYQLMKDLLGMNAEEMKSVFELWNKTELDSYLIDITAQVLGKRDEDGRAMVDKILDAAGQKGTGKWAGISSFEEGVPLTLISESVYSRCLSAMKDERVEASRAYSVFRPRWKGDGKSMIENIRKALLASKIISYAQGFALLRSASETYGWNLDYGRIALLWRGGCIIRSVFLGRIKESFDENPGLKNLLLSPYFKRMMENLISPWREVVSTAVECGIPAPAFGSALSYFDGYTTEVLPANLLQALRDFFGAHTYERVDRPRGEFFHTNWTGSGGSTWASTYTV